MITKQPKSRSSKQTQRVDASASLATILKDLEGLQQLHQFQSTLIQEAIKQIKRLDSR
ncbi:MAG: hypothetical protein KDA86_10895 [Planctomycetaceae bacterium]|nr:hypothetical protein [Planctomycetaceae bacterium]